MSKNNPSFSRAACGYRRKKRKRQAAKLAAESQASIRVAELHQREGGAQQ